MTRKNLLLAGVGALLLGRASAQDKPAKPANDKPVYEPVPELIGTPKDWISGKPIKLSEQKGKVIVACYWTFGCINCKRTLPFWNAMAKKYEGKDVVFVTIHTPELESEHVVEDVKKFIEKEKLVFPVLIDNDKANWKKWRNQWWPATYLIDKKGLVRGRWDGELDFKGSGEYKKVEQGIELLRSEK